MDVGLAEHLSRQAGLEVQQMLLTVASPPGSLRDAQQAAVLAAMARTSMPDTGRLGAMSVRSLIASIVLRTHTPEVYEELTAGKTDGVGAAVKLSKAWPSAPSPGQPFDAGVGARNPVVAGHAGLRYSLMRPPQRVARAI